MLKFKNQVNLKGSKRKANNNDFIPYNKSILTRVIAEQLQRNHILILSHFSKTSINMNFKHSKGPAKNLFNQIDKLMPEKCFLKFLNDKEALKVLQ